MAVLLTVPSAQRSHATTVLGTFALGFASNVEVGINVTAKSGTSPSLQPYLEQLGSDGVWYAIWKPSAITTTGQTVASIGSASKTFPAVLSGQGRLRVTIGGSATPKFTFSAVVVGR